MHVQVHSLFLVPNLCHLSSFSYSFYANSKQAGVLTVKCKFKLPIHKRISRLLQNESTANTCHMQIYSTSRLLMIQSRSRFIVVWKNGKHMTHANALCTLISSRTRSIELATLSNRHASFLLHYLLAACSSNCLHDRVRTVRTYDSCISHIQDWKIYVLR